MVTAIRLAREGYGAGDPQNILKMPVDIVVGIIQYEKFRADYEKTYIEINREKRD